MENTYELGQRFERLLYTSVIIIVFSFIILSLSKSLALSKAISKSTSYQSIIASLNNNEEGIKDIQKIENNFKDYKLSEDKRKQDFEKNNHEAQRHKNIDNENLIRKKLSLPPIIPSEDKFLAHPYIGYDFELSKLNSYRLSVGLSKIKNLDDSHQGEREIIIAIIKKFMIYDKNDIKILIKNLNDNNYNIEKFIFYLKNEINKSKTSSIKILDIDTPVDFPLSIGNMKLSIPMSNIENWALKIAPIFLVIWIGSIFITRSFEVTQLLESKKIINFYPHILNVFNIQSKNLNSDKRNDNVSKALGGSIKETKSLELESIFLSSFRVILLFVMFSFMTVPIYYGFYIYLKSDESQGIVMYLTSIVLPAIINFIQILSCIRFEIITAKKIFIIDGEKNEIL